MHYDHVITLTETDDAYFDDNARLVFRSSAGSVPVDLGGADPWILLALIDDLTGKSEQRLESRVNREPAA